jgi:hypothetical protein
MRVPSLLYIVAILVSCNAAIANAASAGTCSASSPPHRTALVELYTSEGCSSCPPADDWLNTLDRARKTNTIVPLALHVDYWDSSSWKDRFAQAVFTSRQQGLSSNSGAHIIYTPEIFVEGQELRNWSNDASFESRIRQLNAEPPLADIHIDAHASTPGNLSFNAAFKANGTLPDNAVAYAAVYENRLESAVEGGENRGVTLHHDRVVRLWIGPVRVVDGHAEISGSYSVDDGQSGVVAFVESGTTGEVLQVAELSSCGN